MSIADKLTTIAENVPKVYESGKASGVEIGKEEAYSEIENLNKELEQTLYGTDTGGKSQYDFFWDLYQTNGERTNYRGAFMGIGWDDELFKPKYPFGEISDGYMMFANSKISNITNMNFKGSQYAFYNNRVITRLGEIITGDEMYGTFQNATSLVTIERLVINYQNSKNNNYTATFNGCSALESITIEGEFKGSITFQYSPKLTKDSITSIINALSSTATDKTLTLSETAINNAFTDSEWAELIATKTNWTINLV